MHTKMKHRKYTSGIKGISTFSCFLLFYCVFFLVFACSFFVFMRISVNALTKRSLKISEEMLHAGLIQLESTLDTYQSAALTMNRLSSISKVSSLKSEDLKQSFVAGKKPENFYYVKKAAEDFASSAMYLPNKTDMGFILQNGTVLTRQRFHLNAESLYNEFLTCDGYDTVDDWICFLSEGQNASLLPVRSYTTYDNGTYSGLTYCLRFPINSSNTSAWFYVIIGEEHLLSILLHNSSFFSGAITLTDSQGVVLYSNDSAEQISYSDTMRITGKSGISIEFKMPRVLSQAELQDFYLTALFFSIGYILLGIALTVMFSYRSTQPTRIVFDAANCLDETGTFDCPIDHKFATKESKRIMDVLNQSGLALQSYGNELTRQSESVQYYTFTTLLENGPVFLSEDSLIFVKKKLPAKVLLLKVNGDSYDPETNHVSTDVLKVMRETLPSDSLCYPLQGNIAALIFVKKSADDACVFDLRKKLCDIDYRMVLSPLCTDVKNVYEEYTRSYYQLRFPNNNIPFHSNLQMPSNKAGLVSLYTPQTTISRAIVVKMLLSGQINELLGLLDEYESSMILSEDSLKYVFYACTSALSQFYNIQNLSLPALPAYPSGSTADLFKDLRKLLQTAHNSIDNYYNQAPSFRSEEVMRFINSNLSNTNLYVQMVTEQFDISESDLQNIVKATSGLTFFAYVEKMRMTEARRLLEETDLPINAISERCGYASRVTFSRAYKRFHHSNPSSHRKQ